MNNLTLITKLMKEEKYFQKQAELAAEELENMVPELKEALELWVEKKEISPIEVHGLTIEMVMNKRNLDLYHALLDLNYYWTRADKVESFHETTVYIK